jgi:beta-1,2-mannobiose phosphorylase / 1,2-beta-oligomannan phosphorylase
VTILYDRSGERYHRGRGLRVFADGREIAAADTLRRITAPLPPLSPEMAARNRETAAGWLKHAGNPVLGGKYGTCFDVSVLREQDRYRMWVSWRPKKSVALVESADGIQWSEPAIVLGPNRQSDWEQDINRPVVLERGSLYHMWYTGFSAGGSFIGYATSPDGKAWRRMSPKPVLVAEKPWEKQCVMCPHVIWDEEGRCYKMWYSAGERNEPNAIGYATSPDGLNWTKHAGNPIFGPDPSSAWEQHKVTACQVEKRREGYLMFYIGFRDEAHAQIGLARSTSGITAWQRHPDNPVVRPGRNRWDHDACYKPYAIFDGRKWMLWYNGRHGGLEQIGLVTHEGEDLGFGQPARLDPPVEKVELKNSGPGRRDKGKTP